MSLEQTAANLTRQVPLFKGLATDDVAKILARGLTMRAAKDETIFYKNTTGNLMYVILSGSVGIFDGKTHVATLTTGDLFGEMALISDEPRSATAVAMENSHLFVLNEDTFHKLLTKKVSVQLLLNIMGTLSKRLRTANTRLRELQKD